MKKQAQKKAKRIKQESKSDSFKALSEEYLDHYRSELQKMFFEHEAHKKAIKELDAQIQIGRAMINTLEALRKRSA